MFYRIKASLILTAFVATFSLGTGARADSGYHEGGSDIAHGTKKIAHSTMETVKKVAKETGKAIKKAGRETGKAFQKAGRKTKEAFKGSD